MKKLFDWLDDRSGYRQVIAHALDEDVRGGASYAYVFGSVLTFILVLQMTTGVFLAMYYSPSATDAWGSVAYIQDSVTMGWFIRGLHSYGASAMVIVAGLHLLQTALYGAYKKPRELNWIVGVLMLGIILAFALTGYLLPWDQTGYWATKVATNIAGTSPLVGEQVQQITQAGNEYGNLTITRFFAIHVFILPGALIALVVAHIALFRKHGVTPKWGRSDKELDGATEPFWPEQMFKDMVAMAVVFIALVSVNVYTHGVKLDGPADPASQFDARPEWYFRALFQALKYFEGAMQQIVELGAPVVVGGVLLALPFVDRGEDRSPRARIPFLGVIGLGVVLVGILTVISFQEDASDPRVQKGLAEAHEQAQLARSLAKEHGVPTAGGIAVYTTQEHYEAKKLWADYCASCHEGEERKAPVVSHGYNSRAWLAAFLKDPNGDEFFGVTNINDMEPVELTGVDFDAVVEYLYAQTGATDARPELVSKGQTLFEDTCTDCHPSTTEPLTGTAEDWSAPDVRNRGTVDNLAALIRDAGDLAFFGSSNEMPVFDRSKLSEDERYVLAEYLVWLRTAPPQTGRDTSVDKTDDKGNDAPAPATEAAPAGDPEPAE